MALPIAALLWGSVACAGAQEDGGFPDLQARRSAALPVQEVARSREDTLFTEITGLDVDSRGHIYVADWYAGRVAVLDSTGALVRTIGRKGLGPGEFRGMRGVQVLSGDSLLVYDPGAARLSIFPPGSAAPARTLNLGAVLQEQPPFLVWQLRDGGYVALFRPPFTAGETTPRMDRLRRLRADGSPEGEPLHSVPSRSFLYVRNAGGFSVTPNPFGREGLFALGPGDALHLAWSDSLAVETIRPDGRRIGGFSVPHRAPTVEAGDVDAAVAGFPAQAARAFRPALQDSLPERWPAMRALVADPGGGGVWAGLNSSEGQPGEWARFDADGRYRGSVFLPRDVLLMAAHGARLYGVRTSADGIPRIEVYRVSALAAGGNG
jgi:6-bladed beta-propeller